MNERRALAVVLVTAAALRFSGIGWDGFTLQNPDERFLAFVAERLALPHSFPEALSPQLAPSNPNNHGFDFYVYGALPPLANRLVARLAGSAGLEGIVAAGRVMTTLLDLLCLVLAASLARRLGGERAGLVAAVLWGTCGLAIQQARFATVDVWGTTAVLTAAWAVVGRPLSFPRVLLSGVAVGLATACRPNLAALVLVPFAAVALEWWRGRGSPDRHGVVAILRLAVVALGAVVALKIADPGAFASASSLMPSPRRLDALRQLGSIVAGEGQYPPNLQWANRRTFLDPAANLLLWGTGPLLGFAVLAGLGTVFRRSLMGKTAWLPFSRGWSRPPRGN